MNQPDDSETIDAAIRQFRRGGWSIGDTAFTTEAGSLAWVVSGTNGSTTIRAEGSTKAEAWSMAVEMARSLGALES